MSTELDRIQTTTNFVDFGLDRVCKMFQNFRSRTGFGLSLSETLGAGPNLDSLKWWHPSSVTDTFQVCCANSFPFTSHLADLFS